MFDEITLIAVTESKTKTGEIIESETRQTVPVEMQTIKREIREKYNERGNGRALRFRINFFGPEYNLGQVPYFEHEGVRYGVTDFIKDKTGTGYFIEGTSVKGRY